MKHAILIIAALVLSVADARAETLVFDDPAGDDFGPGKYKYPTDAVYRRGSFDIRKVEIEDKGTNIEIRVSIGARIQDPWKSRSWQPRGNGFSLQMVQIYIDNKASSGFKMALPGINAVFAAKDAWDKVIVISPQGAARLKQEAKAKAGALSSGVVIPLRTYARGQILYAVVRRPDLGGAPSKSWGVQVVMQSNEGFPGKTEMLSRKVNEVAGKHRFGGGNDFDCDPHVLDILVAPAKGGADEKDGQKKALRYECGDEGESVKRAILPMVRLQ